MPEPLPLSKLRGDAPEQDCMKLNPRLTGGGYFLPPSPPFFLQYLPMLRTDRRQIFNIRKPSILHVLTKAKLVSFDTSAINDVRVTSCFPGFKQK